MRALIFPLCFSTFSSSSVLRVTLYPDNLPSLEYVQKRQVPMTPGNVPRPPGIPPFNVPPPPFPPPFLQPRLKNNYRKSPAFRVGYAAGNGIHRGKKSMADAVNAFKTKQTKWHWPRQAASFRPTVEVNEPEFVPSPLDTNLNSLDFLPRPQTDLGLRQPKKLVSSSNGNNGILVIPMERTPITNAVHGKIKGSVNQGAKIKISQPFITKGLPVIPDEKSPNNVIASIKVSDKETPPPIKTNFGFKLGKLKKGKKEKAASIETSSLAAEDEAKKEVFIEVNPPKHKEDVRITSGTYDPFEFKGLKKGLNDITTSSFGTESEEFDMNVGLEMVEAAIEGLKRGLGQGSKSFHQADEGIETEIGIDMVEEAIKSIQPLTKRTARGKQQILQRIRK